MGISTETGADRPTRDFCCMDVKYINKWLLGGLTLVVNIPIYSLITKLLLFSV